MAAMKAMSWERILFVYVDNYYGISAMDEIIRRSHMENVCIVETISLPATSDIGEYIVKLQDIARYNVKGAVFFGAHPAALAVSVNPDVLGYYDHFNACMVIVTDIKSLIVAIVGLWLCAQLPTMTLFIWDSGIV